MTDSSWQIATAYAPDAPLPFTSYSCSSLQITEPCASISPPPPPRAPSAPREERSATGAYVYSGSGGNWSATGGGGGWTPQMWGRKLAQAPSASGPSICTVYYRQVTFLTTLTLVATPPESCGGGYCANTTWTYALAPACSAVYAPSTFPIDEATYAADVADGNSWCPDWPSFLAPPTASVVLRSAADPYVEAGALTNCTYAFKTASAGYANAGFFFVINGLGIALASMFCLEGMCTPRSLAGLLGAPSPIDSAEAGGIMDVKGVGAGYGAASSTEAPPPVELARAGSKWA